MMSFPRYVLLALALGLSPAAAAPAQPLDEVTLAGGRRYLAALPDRPDGAPLVIALHGGGGSPEQFAADSDLVARAVAAGFIVALPAGTSRRGAYGLLTWNGGYCCGYAQRAGIDDIGFLRAVAADARDRFGAGDALFLTGMSNGAILAQAFAAAARPGEVRAVASVAGSFDAAAGGPAARVPLLHIHGTADGRVPYAGGQGEDGLVSTSFAPVAAVIAAFRAPYGAGPPDEARMIDRQDDGTRVGVSTWIGRDGRPETVLMTVEGGGHAWPGGRRSARKAGTTREISAPAEIVAFFVGQL